MASINSSFMYQLACLQDVPTALAKLYRRAQGIYRNSPEVPDVWVHERDSHLVVLLGV